MTRFIGVVNQKGGSGKTTLATHLAVGLIYSEYSVLLVDSDPQKSASDWRAAGLEHKRVVSPQVIGIPRNTVGKEVRDLPMAKHYDFVIIDGCAGASATTSTASIIKAADLLLIPVQPSPYDIWATQEVLDMVETRQELTDGQPQARYVISMGQRRGVLHRDALEALTETRIPVLENGTHLLTDYKKTAASGGTIFDSKQMKDEIHNVQAIVEEVLGLFEVEREDAMS